MNRLTASGLALAVVATAMPLAAGDEDCVEDTTLCLREMAEKIRKKGWVGIELDRHDSGENLVVRRVVEESPAEAAGFQVGDVLLALNGVEYAEKNRDALKKAYAGVLPGHVVTYTVGRADERVDLEVELARVPETVLAQWIGYHMLEHHVEQTAP